MKVLRACLVAFLVLTCAILKSGQEVLKSSLMECVVALVAEWISLGEMIKLQELSTLISDALRDWQDHETMEWFGDQIWNKKKNEEWAEYMCGEGNSPAL